MMTPVYDVAIVDWKTNNCDCGEYSNAARLGSPVISTINNHTTAPLSAASKLFVFSCFQYVKKCISEPLTKQQLEKKISSTQRVLPILSNLQHILINRLYSCEIISLTYDNIVNCGRDVLWQLTNSELKVTQSESNVIDGYIKEQSAGHTTTATDEEK